MNTQPDDLLRLSAQIVAAHAGHQAVSTAELPRIIRDVYGTLEALAAEHCARTAGAWPDEHHDHGHAHHGHDHHGHHHLAHAHHEHEHEGHAHAMPASASSDQAADAALDPRQTVFADRLICLEDGESMKTLKRHLRTVHGMTPEDYRAKWGLPDDYPMVAADYARRRSEMATQGFRDQPKARQGKRRRL